VIAKDPVSKKNVSLSNEPSLSGSETGIALIQITMIIGIMSIIAISIATLSNSSLQGLKHMRMGNDLDALKGLIKLALTRPQTPQEAPKNGPPFDPGTKVCLATLPDLKNYRYDGKEYPASPDQSLRVVGPSGNNLLRSLIDLQANNNRPTDYSIKARLVKTVAASTPIIYPDQTGSPKTYNLWKTNILIVGEKVAGDDQGGKILRGEIPLGLITDPATGYIFDCIVDPTDYEQICRTLGGKYDITKTPNCLLTRAAVAGSSPPLTEWDKLPNAQGFTNGDLFTENRILIGNTERIDWSLNNWQAARSLLIGGTQKNGMTLGQNKSNAVGISTDLNNSSIFAIFSDIDSSNGIFPAGKAIVRTYGSRPFVFSNVYPLQKPNIDSDHLIMDPTKKMLINDGLLLATNPDNNPGLMNGSESIPLLDNVGLAAAYSDGRRIALGTNQSSDMGLWSRKSGQTDGAIYFSRTHSAIDSSFGGFVFKHYKGGDLVFVRKQSTDGVAMTIKGNSNIGINESNPQARLHINGVGSLGLRVDGTSTIQGELIVNGPTFVENDTRVTRDIWGNQTVSADSDFRLKTAIKPIEGALEKILKLNGVYFRWKNPLQSQKRQIGVIAQNVEEVFPELVINNRDGTKSVAYQNLVAPIIEAIHTQDSLLREIRDKNTKLNVKLEKILKCLNKDDTTNKK
jgi:hypothetical protein